MSEGSNMTTTQDIITRAESLLSVVTPGEWVSQQLEVESQRNWILAYFLEAYDPDPPCCIPGAECPFGEATKLKCDSNEGPENQDYEPCWLAIAQTGKRPKL